jgi:hypothetical protein
MRSAIARFLLHLTIHLVCELVFGALAFLIASWLLPVVIAVAVTTLTGALHLGAKG